MIKTLVKYINIILPNYFSKLVDKKVLDNKLKKHRERKKRVFVTLSQIEEILDQIDFTSDTIIHSSTSNIGKIEGNAVQLTDLIVSKIDLNIITLLAPALPFRGPMKDYLDSIDVFDLSKAINAMGNISNMIMKKDNCKRSFHPTHSVIAIGNNANSYTLKHELCVTPFCKTSPYYKLAMNDGKILMFGVNLNSVTNFHVYEDMLGSLLPFNVYADEYYQVQSIYNANKIVIKTKAHNPFLSSKRNCERARKYLIDYGYIETFTIGDSEISILDAKGLTITLLEMLLLGKSIYGKVRLSKEQIMAVDKLLADLS